MSRFLVIGGVSYDTIIQMDAFPQPASANLYAAGAMLNSSMSAIRAEPSGMSI